MVDILNESYGVVQCKRALGKTMRHAESLRRKTLKTVESFCTGMNPSTHGLQSLMSSIAHSGPKLIFEPAHICRTFAFQPQAAQKLKQIKQNCGNKNKLFDSPPQ
jgi:hypothetical protein